MRVCLVSLGCPKNQVDGETMLGLLGMAGHEIAATPDAADLVLVNTCAFIRDAQRESVDTILHLAQLKRNGVYKHLVVTGCLAQRHGGELLAEITELDAALGTGQVGQVVGLAAELGSSADRPHLAGPPGYLPAGVVPRLLTTPPWTAYLKVSEGCDNRCRYCVIPDLRGPHRGRELGHVVEEAHQLVAAGAKEIVLVGQDLTRWGSDPPPSVQLGLADLVTALVAIDGLRWLRLHYLHPARVDRDLLGVMAAEPKVCRYLDLPMQHGDDTVLAAMGRGVTAGDMARLVAAARAMMPSVAVRSSFIVGFPGETDVAFAALLRLMKEVQADWAGVFAYSREAGTPAAESPDQVPGRIKTARRAKALALQRRISGRRNRDIVGSELEVLVETGPGPTPFPGGERRLALRGRSYREAPGVDGSVYVALAPADPGPVPRPGQLVMAEISGAGPYDLFGDLALTKTAAGR